MNTSDIKNTGKRISKLLKDMDKNMSDLARYVGVAAQTVHKWAAGTAVPRDKNLSSVAEFLGVTPQYLLFGDDSEKVSKVVIGRFDNEREPERTRASYGNAENLGEAVVVVGEFLESNQMVLTKNQRGVLTMLVCDSIERGLRGDFLMEYLSQLITLVDNSQLSDDELALVQAYRNASDAKKSLMLMHTKGGAAQIDNRKNKA